ncbi:hypothetical protein GCM10025880_02560 [Methylorubrum aminovorans]|nr:hypothetical protein GCM10025880_02560 [Methylorubrum aminovorans]
MADQNQGAGIVAEHLLQQVEGLEVEVVGGLVEHEEVGGLGERPRDQQAVALAAREHAHRGARLFGAEKEVLEIADHVAAAPTHRDAVAAPPVRTSVTVAVFSRTARV